MEVRADRLDSTEERFNPFPGLRPFEPDEDHLFFGRERETDELLRRLRTHRFVPVLGTSGSGKSSLVRSGLIPSLYSGFMVKAGSDWRVAVFRPGEDPIGNLAKALDDPDVLDNGGELAEANRMLLESTLRRSDLGLADCVRHAHLPKEQNLLVVVDQFEELFRFRETRREHGGSDDAVAFAKLLLAAANQDRAPVYVVITMRSDFIGDCMEYPGLPEAINDGQYLIPRMTRDELRQAVTGPVAVGGGRIAPRLVTRLLNEVGDDPDQLPVLQHAMMRTWDHWVGGTTNDEPLDLPHYEAVGTMADALSLHAEEAYAELRDDRDREISERLFKALTDKRMDDRGVRRPTAVDDVAAVAAVENADVVRVVEVFRRPGRSFLMPPVGIDLVGDSILDLSHESLMRNWKRLAEWVDEETTSGKSYRRLSRAARRHENGEGSLWVEPELSLGLMWREDNKPTAAWAHRYDPTFERVTRFLDQSREAHVAAIRAEEDARRAKLRRARILSVVLGSAALVTFVFGVVALQARQAAKAQAETARAVSDFMVSLFEVADPEEARGSTITAQEILDEGARKIEVELAGQPQVQARMLTTIGKVYGSLGLYDRAEPLLQRSVEMARSALGDDHPDTLAAMHRLAEAHWNEGRYQDAEELYLTTLKHRRAQLGNEDPATLETLIGLSEVYESQGRYGEAEASARESMEGGQRVLGPEHQQTLKAAQLVAAALHDLGRFPEAETLLVETYETQQRTLGDGHPDSIASMGALGALYTDLGRYDEAEALYAANLERRREVFGEEHPKTFTALVQLAGLDQDRGRWDDAEDRLDAVVAGRQRVLGPEHPSTLLAQGTLAWLYRLQSRLEESERLVASAFEVSKRTLGEEHETTRILANTLAATYLSQGQYPESERLFSENLEISRQRHGEESPDTFSARNNLGVAYGSWGRIDKQEEMYRQNVEIANEFYGEDHPQTLFYNNNLVAILNGQRRYDEAEELGEDSLEKHRKVLGSDNPQTLTAMRQLIGTYGGQRRLEDLERLGIELIGGYRRVFGDDHPETLNALNGAANFYQGNGRFDEALSLLEQVLEGRRRFYGEEHSSTIGAYAALAWLFENTDQPERGLELRRQAMEIRRRMATVDDAGPRDVHRYASSLTYARAELQNPSEALRFAERAAEMTDRENRNYLATLANAQFLNGKVQEAIATQKQAIALLAEDDTRARTGFEERLGEFYRASGDSGMKRQAQIDELTREKEAALKPGASPRARNDYARELLTADPPDLQDPREALAIALAVNEETNFEDVDLLFTLGLAYHLSGQRQKAVETQEQVIARTPESDIWAIESNKTRLDIFRGEGSRDFDVARVLTGAWGGPIGPLHAGVTFERDGEYIVAVNREQLPWIPVGVVWWRFNVENGEAEAHASDAGWTNLRWESIDYRLKDDGDLLMWTRDWNVITLRKN